MNKRIQEFKIKSLEWNAQDQVWEINAEKFAGFIVKECAGMLDQDSYLMPELGGYAHDMRAHFGVKE